MSRPINRMQVKRATDAFMLVLTNATMADETAQPARQTFETAMVAALDAAQTIRAPFTSDEVEALNTFQIADYVHPFTCPYEHSGQDRRLKATAAGWVCPHCNYTQAWAHGLMLETWTGNPS